MSTQFANTLNNHPIYADRAEKDAAGNTITTTYQEKLTSGTGITIDSSNVISATGGGGTTYTAGTGIDISAQDAISVKIDGSTITTNASGQLVANGGGSSSGITVIHQYVSHLMPPTWTVGDLTFTADYNGRLTVTVSSSTVSSLYSYLIKSNYGSSGRTSGVTCPGDGSSAAGTYYTPIDLTSGAYTLIRTDGETDQRCPYICDGTFWYDTGVGYKQIHVQIMAWVRSDQNMGEIWYSYTSN